MKSKQTDKTNEIKCDSDGVEERAAAAATSHINRRTKLFKSKQPDKCEILTSSIMSSDFVYHRGSYMQIGDVVALYDIDEKEMVYFAQIRAFLIDQYGSNYIFINALFF